MPVGSRRCLEAKISALDHAAHVQFHEKVHPLPPEWIGHKGPDPNSESPKRNSSENTITALQIPMEINFWVTGKHRFLL